jgi:4-amino-4-deoxy-L-arabinose transferase-like glycosyltransferase
MENLNAGEKRISPSLFASSFPNLLLLAIIFIAALGARLFDLADLPNDFYMVRQYRSLLIARGMYYASLPGAPEWQRETAIAQWKGEGLIEPPIMEGLTALIYHLVGEHIWVGKVLASLFWVAGGLALLLLARDVQMQGGGLIALVYYLIIPFGLGASQAFMPDPLMTALIAWSLWALHRWWHSPGWKHAILAGILVGVAILVKSVAVFILLGAALGMLLSRRPFRKALKNRQTWVIAALAALPTILFYVYGLVITDALQGQFGLRFFPALLKDPSFYIRWLFIATGVVGPTALFAALLGILLLHGRALQTILLGALGGYLVYGVAFPYHILTHEYYHLPLIPLVAVGIIPAANLLVRAVQESRLRGMRVLFCAILLAAMGMEMWKARNYKVSTDYRHEIPYWQELGEKIGRDKNIVELSGDYGYRLAYFGWVSGLQWSTVADDALRTLAGQALPSFEEAFSGQTAGKDLFVITSPPEWENQDNLRTYLQAHYPLVEEGEGYWIFNLKP